MPNNEFVIYGLECASIGMLVVQVACIERLSPSLAVAGKSSILFYQEVDIMSL
jgi:hypothetical protein